MVFYLFVVGILYFIYFFRKTIFIDPTTYYYIFSTITQGFIALVAFLGTVIIFRLQLYENEMEKISDSVSGFIKYYRGTDINTYSAIEMMRACQDILAVKSSTAYRLEIEKIYHHMSVVNTTKGETRNQMVEFTIISFVNVSLALISLVFPQVLKSFPAVGLVVTIFNISLSIFSLFFAWRVVRSAVGYSYKM
jgi:hypothetical protein